MVTSQGLEDWVYPAKAVSFDDQKQRLRRDQLLQYSQEACLVFKFTGLLSLCLSPLRHPPEFQNTVPQPCTEPFQTSGRGLLVNFLASRGASRKSAYHAILPQHRTALPATCWATEAQKSGLTLRSDMRTLMIPKKLPELSVSRVSEDAM